MQQICVQLISLHAINRFKIAENFPEDKDAVTYGELSNRTGLEESVLRRTLRHAMTARIFTEPTKDSVAHTAASKVLTTPYMHQRIDWTCNEIWPAATKVHNRSSCRCVEQRLTSGLGGGCAG